MRDLYSLTIKKSLFFVFKFVMITRIQDDTSRRIRFIQIWEERFVTGIATQLTNIININKVVICIIGFVFGIQNQSF